MVSWVPFLRSATEALEGAADLLLLDTDAGFLDISAARSKGSSAWDLEGGGRGRGRTGLWLGAAKA